MPSRHVGCAVGTFEDLVLMRVSARPDLGGLQDRFGIAVSIRGVGPRPPPGPPPSTLAA
jgi:hypothetical protein